jgi:hypothetical protein
MVVAAMREKRRDGRRDLVEEGKDLREGRGIDEMHRKKRFDEFVKGRMLGNQFLGRRSEATRKRFVRDPENRRERCGAVSERFDVFELPLDADLPVRRIADDVDKTVAVIREERPDRALGAADSLAVDLDRIAAIGGVDRRNRSPARAAVGIDDQESAEPREVLGDEQSGASRRSRGALRFLFIGTHRGPMIASKIGGEKPDRCLSEVRARGDCRMNSIVRCSPREMARGSRRWSKFHKFRRSILAGRRPDANSSGANGKGSR